MTNKPRLWDEELRIIVDEYVAAERLKCYAQLKDLISRISRERVIEYLNKAKQIDRHDKWCVCDFCILVDNIDALITEVKRG